MKAFCRLFSSPALFAGFALVISVAPGHAEDLIIDQFNDAGGLTGWRFDYGGVSQTIEFDATQDAEANAASGSMKVTLGFDAAALNPSGNNKGAVTIDFSGRDGSAYLSLEMDLKIETGSAADSSGNSGFFQMVIRNTGNYDFNSQFGASVSTNSGWRHIKVAPLAGAVGDIRAITLELYGGAALTGPVIFYVDNVKFTKPSATQDILISQFDDAGGLSRWRFDYGGVTHQIQFDPTQDAKGSATSGSMKLTYGFDALVLNPSGNNKGAVTIDLPAPLDGSAYLSMELDLKVDPDSSVGTFGDSGFFQMVIRNTGNYDFNSQFGDSVNLADGWRHITVSPLMGGVDDIRAITLELYGGGDLTGPVTFYIDNVKFTELAAPPPGPTLSMERPVRGLNLVPTSGQYQRQNIATINRTGYGWVGYPDPVTYAVTIDSYPDASHNGFQTHLFLVSGSPGAESFPDYNEPNVVFLDIQNQADGSTQAFFRYKTNETAGNTFLYTPAPAGGTLGNVTNSTALGTWSLSFSQDTNVTVTTPGGATGHFTLPPEAAALFQEPLTVYVGAQPNSGANIGQAVILGRFQILNGATSVLDDDFLADQNLDAATWQVLAGDPLGVRLVGPDAAFWLSWTIPDTGYKLQSNITEIGDENGWSDSGLITSQFGSKKKTLVHVAEQPDPNLGFFRLLKSP